MRVRKKGRHEDKQGRKEARERRRGKKSEGETNSNILIKGVRV